jgi:hypothetical protein
VLYTTVRTLQIVHIFLSINNRFISTFAQNHTSSRTECLQLYASVWRKRQAANPMLLCEVKTALANLRLVELLCLWVRSSGLQQKLQPIQCSGQARKGTRPLLNDLTCDIHEWRWVAEPCALRATATHGVLCCHFSSWLMFS